jgi:integrase/recombinase XerD
MFSFYFIEKSINLSSAITIFLDWKLSELFLYMWVLIWHMLEKLETELKLRGVSPETVKTYLFYNKKFLEFIKKNPEDISEDDIKSYLADMLTRSVSNATLALAKACLTFFYRELLGKKINIKTPKIAKQVPVVLTREEVKRMIDLTENKKHHLLLEFIYSTGTRLSECINMKISDLELDGKIGWVRSGKGNKDRMILLSDKLITDLKDYLGQRKKSSEYIFSGWDEKLSKRSVQKIVNLAAKRANINKPVHVHTLRHCYATHLLESGVDIRKIQLLLGHSSLNTTQLYTSVSKSELIKIKNPLDEL